MDVAIAQKLHWTDGVVWDVDNVVVDPRVQEITHLVAQPHRHHERARLIPLDRLEERDGEFWIALGSGAAQEFPLVEQRRFIRLVDYGGTQVDANAALESALAFPYFFGRFDGLPGPEMTVERWDEVPEGEVEFGRHSEVVDRDGRHLGHVEGFLCEGKSITHVILQRGHLLRKRDVAIPVAAIREIDTGQARLNIGMDDVDALPELADWGVVPRIAGER